ncbi:MAG: hypothetical protein J3Q66DRAFT_348426 [Benniella sp.]|nr:MAG: hypothetical protein J3Q66DRAFT_348426 [Benniella sp.]
MGTKKLVVATTYRAHWWRLFGCLTTLGAFLLVSLEGLEGEKPGEEKGKETDSTSFLAFIRHGGVDALSQQWRLVGKNDTRKVRRCP